MNQTKKQKLPAAAVCFLFLVMAVFMCFHLNTEAAEERYTVVMRGTRSYSGAYEVLDLVMKRIMCFPSLRWVTTTPSAILIFCFGGITGEAGTAETSISRNWEPLQTRPGRERRYAPNWSFTGKCLMDFL